MELRRRKPPEVETRVSSALEEIDRNELAKDLTITCHGKDDYSF